MEKSFKLKLPAPPNFILIEGFTEVSIPVSDLTAEEANQYAEELKKAFIKHWQSKKNSRPTIEDVLSRKSNV